MRIGICQTDIFFEDKERNLNAAEKYIKAVSDSKVRLALFPEMSMTGFTMKPECFYEDEKADLLYSLPVDLPCRLPVRLRGAGR